MALLPAENFRSVAALCRFLLPAVIGVVLDLWTKFLAFQKLALGVTIAADGRPDVLARPAYQFIPGWLHFHVTANPGAVFGMGSGGRWLFVLVSVAAVFFLVYLFATSDRHRMLQFIMGVLMAGVVGNLYDRMVYGYVRDMIYVLPRRNWPGTGTEIFPWIFNVADVLLCCGVGLWIIYYGLAKSPPPRTPPTTGS